MFKIALNCSTHVNDLMQLESQTKTVLSDFYL